MFTGLVQDIGTISSSTPSRVEAKLTISSALDDLDLGESVAVNGVCLSVTSVEPGRFTVFTSAETLAKTSLGAAGPGGRVNLERALRMSDRLGGHIVTGHVDTLVRIVSRDRVGEAERWRLSVPEDRELVRQIAPKGSVTLDGVSLTVNSVSADVFEVMIIPITLAHTTLKDAVPGARINLETDVLAKYVASSLCSNEAEGGVTLELLARNGFVR